MQQIPAFDHGKRYRPLSQHYKERFGEKVFKVSVSIADSCPNREGKQGMDVCIFCDEWGSAAYHQYRDQPILEQININREAIRKRYRAQKFLIYFQAYTNTFGRFKELESLYQVALEEKDVVGIVVGTRPDCLPKRVLRKFAEIAQKNYLSVELGVQTFDDAQLKFLSRGHDSACSLSAIRKLKSLADLNLCVHLMFGLPEETDAQIRDTANILSELGVDGVKLHNLHVLRNTKLETLYREALFVPVELEEYTRKVSLFLENLSPKIAVHRLAAVASRWDELVAPAWTKEKMRPTQFIDDYLTAKGTWQGRCYDC
ncbi:MAG: TIGR01212 family radical SAM protein [SAR324 cluster bacterium]|nr:TIGR01212 family radical SAM protein [SAR324 cluster bacterium]MBL7035771.1 TIGR01212 family radical SAM protein [SAR324 cluster bacterium]